MGLARWNHGPENQSSYQQTGPTKKLFGMYLTEVNEHSQTKPSRFCLDPIHLIGAYKHEKSSAGIGQSSVVSTGGQLLPLEGLEVKHEAQILILSFLHTNWYSEVCCL